MYPITADPQVAIRVARQHSTERRAQAVAARQAREARIERAQRQETVGTSKHWSFAARLVLSRWATGH